MSVIVVAPSTDVVIGSSIVVNGCCDIATLVDGAGLTVHHVCGGWTGFGGSCSGFGVSCGGICDRSSSVGYLGDG